jgi:hypothetical protein
MESIATPSCNTSTLTSYIPSAQDPWNVSKIQHVYRRLGLGASQTEVDDALVLSPSAFIDQLVDNAAALPLTETPFWGYWSYSDFTDYETENPDFINQWRIQAANDILSNGLRDRMSFFWMNHFVTELETYFYGPYLFQYYNLMQTHALGNFKDFVREVGINSAMLIYLNGFDNTNQNPNENYARELYELFTLGEGNNYTETDITETARALTGYNHWTDYGAPITFNVSTHDTGSKTIFDQTGNWGYDDVIDILFEQRANEIATMITTKLYRFFMSEAVDGIVQDDIIAPLAQILIDNNWELIPLLKELFKSEHFYDDRARGIVIKSPYDLIFNYINETGFYHDNEIMQSFIYYTALMGQEIFDPQDVSGWQRDETWINSSTLTGRWQLIELYNGYLFNDPTHVFLLVDLARALSNDSNDPYYITQVMVNHFVSKELHTLADYDVATDIFKWDVPQNYYDEGTWNLSWETAPYQVYLLLNHIARMPEFQLK